MPAGAPAAGRRSLEEPVKLDYSKTNGGPNSVVFNNAQQLRHRGPSSQANAAGTREPQTPAGTLENSGAIPKRTESLYFKPFQEGEQGKVYYSTIHILRASIASKSNARRQILTINPHKQQLQENVSKFLFRSSIIGESLQIRDVGENQE